MEKPKAGLERAGYEYETLMNLLQVSVSKHLRDEHYTLVWANDYYYDLIGYQKEEYEALYHNQPDLYYKNEELGIDDQKLWEQIVEQVVGALKTGADGYSLVSQMRRKSGEYVWVRFVSKFADEVIDGCQVSYTTMTDISDVMRIQLEQSVTYDNLPGFVAKYQVGPGLAFKLMEANDRFFAFFGKDSVKNEDYPLFAANVARNRSVFMEQEAAMMKGDPVRFTVRMSNQFGQDAWLQINASCIGWQNGEAIYLAIYIDITTETELRRMQKQLEAQAEQLQHALVEAEAANRAKSEFLSRMSHDIRTPLNAVLGMKDIAQSHMDDPDKVRDCLKKIGLSGQHLLGLINDVLDMSKIESGEMVLREDTMSLPEVLENIVTIMQPQFKEKKQRFSIRLQEVVHEQFLSDALRLRQVFLNILSNACKFTPIQGAVTMDVRELSVKGDTALFSFTITDTGMGMKPEFLTTIFTAFSRERDSRVDKIEGTGLGMAITKKIVDMLGGTIEVESELGKGTSFHVTLPLKTENLPLAEGRFPDLRVLVTDDDEMMCEQTAAMLEQIGIHADWVDSGAQAVERIIAQKQTDQTYDAILLDWKMPDLDGLETTLRIRELCGDQLPVLIISAYDWSDIEKTAKKAGVTGFIQKPIFISTLIHGLQRYVLKGQPGLSEQSECRQADFSGKRFLLVEDNVLNQEVAAELLSDMGAEVVIAGNGAEGVDLFGGSAKGFLDVILMDVQMPVMNGYEAARAIRLLPHPEAQTIPILAMTADAFAEDIRAAKEAGMNGHMAKPLDKTTLQREIGKYLKN